MSRLDHFKSIVLACAVGIAGAAWLFAYWSA